MSKFPVAKNLRVEELIELYDGIIEDVAKELAASQISDTLPVPEAPEGLEQLISYTSVGDPGIPEDLTELQGPSLGKLFSFISNWANYVQAEMTRAKCVHLVIKRNCKVVENALKVYYRDEMDTPSSHLDEKVTTDERFVQIDSSSLRAEVFVKKAEARYEQYKRSLNLISREQTRRGEEFERTNYANSSGRVGGGDPLSSRWKRR